MRVADFRRPRSLLLGVTCILSAVLLSGAGDLSYGQIAKHTKGKISKNIYTSPDGDFRVAIPNANVPGAAARDEGALEVWQAIFTDDLGGFYRLISMKNPSGELKAENVLTMEPYAKAFDKETLQTSRGSEVHFVDVEKNGSEMTVTTFQKQPDGSLKSVTNKPDLITANAVFEANERLYHLIAGVTMMDLVLPDNVFDSKRSVVVVPTTKEKMDQAAAVRKAKERLAKLLEGFQVEAPKR